MKRAHRLVVALWILCAFLFCPAPGKAQTSLEIRLTVVSPETGGLASPVSQQQPQVHLATIPAAGSEGINGNNILLPVSGSGLTAEKDLRAPQEAVGNQKVKFPFIPPVRNLGGGDRLPSVQPAVAVVLIMVPVPVTAGGNQPTIRMLHDTGTQHYAQHPIEIPAPCD